MIRGDPSGAAHHLHGVHAGYLRVRGSAPGGLRWELGDGSPLVNVFTGGGEARA